MLRASTDSPMSFSLSQPEDGAVGDSGSGAGVAGNGRRRGGYKDETVSAALKRRAPSRSVYYHFIIRIMLSLYAFCCVNINFVSVAELKRMFPWAREII